MQEQHDSLSGYLLVMHSTIMNKLKLGFVTVDIQSQHNVLLARYPRHVTVH